MPWCFAIVNGRLAEIFFEEKRGKPHITGHCYVKREEYKTRQEQKWIDQDTARLLFTCRKGKYKRIEPKWRGRKKAAFNELVAQITPANRHREVKVG